MEILALIAAFGGVIIMFFLLYFVLVVGVLTVMDEGYKPRRPKGDE